MQPVVGFNYAALDVRTARAIRVSAERIRQLVKRSLDDIVEIGAELISVKQTLPHGEFRTWLHSEFDWRERSARNFMNVAQRFKSATLADLELDVTAAYLLASPSTPEHARTLAIERAENGEHITYATVRDIINDTKSRQNHGPPNRVQTQARQRALGTLDRLKQRWPEAKTQELAQLLREFADSLDNAS